MYRYGYTEIENKMPARSPRCMRRVRADAEPCVGVSGVYGCVYREPATTTWEAPPPPAPPPPPAEHHAQATANHHPRESGAHKEHTAPRPADHYCSRAPPRHRQPPPSTTSYRRAPPSTAEHRRAPPATADRSPRHRRTTADPAFFLYCPPNACPRRKRDARSVECTYLKL